MSDLLLRRLQISAMLADIEALEAKLNLPGNEAAEALKTIDRIERRLATNFRTAGDQEMRAKVQADRSDEAISQGEPPSPEREGRE